MWLVPRLGTTQQSFLPITQPHPSQNKYQTILLNNSIATFLFCIFKLSFFHSFVTGISGHKSGILLIRSISRFILDDVCMVDFFGSFGPSKCFWCSVLWCTWRTRAKDNLTSRAPWRSLRLFRHLVRTDLQLGIGWCSWYQRFLQN